MSVKRVYTEERHDAARRTFANPTTSTLGEDLVNALQNVGARVRKNVNEGYTTSRFTTPEVSPNRPRVPSSSAISSTNASPIRAPMFRSAADTLHVVYSSTMPQALASSTASPSRLTKRARPADDEDDEPPHHLAPIPRSAFLSQHFDAADRMQVSPSWHDDDDEDVDMDAPELPPITPSRQIRPLKHRSRNWSGQENGGGSISGKGDSRSKSPLEEWRVVDISTLASLPPD